MKRFIVQYVVLIAATVAACIIARAGYITLAILVMAVYATVMIWSSYRDQAERNLFDSLTYRHVKELIEDNQRLAEALIALKKTSPFLETRGEKVYAIDLPDQKRLILYRHIAEEDEQED